MMNDEATQKLAATLNAGMDRFRASVEDAATEMINAAYQMGREQMADEILDRMGLKGHNGATAAEEAFEAARARFYATLGIDGGNR
jgi:hypothetical protein